jgi:glycosyltransferase involved in cell wall biosynthesis
MATPLISICMPNLNKRPFLEARMESLLAQSFRDWELVVCDSHSTDGSWELLRKFEADPRIRLLQIPREGVYAGMNHALRIARGRWLNIATSDDTCSPGFLSTLAALVEKHPGPRIALSDFTYIDRDGREIADRFPQKREFYGDWLGRPHLRDGRSEFLLHCAYGTTWVTLHALLFHRELLGRTGWFRTDQGSNADEEWSLRACLGSDILFQPERLVTWRQYDGQATEYMLSPDRKFALLRSLRALLRDPEAGIPETWRKIDGWSEKIESIRQANYLETLRLFRPAIRESPMRALSGAAHALRNEPAYLLRQAASGFAPGAELRLRGADAAADMLRTFGTPWPPRAL